MIVPFPAPEPDSINFGDLPDAINALLQQGVAAYRRDFKTADALFRQALEAAPQELPTYFCLYKIHTYQGNLDEARAAAQAGLVEARAPGRLVRRLASMACRTGCPGRRRAFRALYIEGAGLYPSAS